MSFIRRAIALLSSYGLACLLLSGLFVLTLLGTLEQGTIGLHAAQEKYFSSLVVWVKLPGGLALPVFPGGYTLMTLLSVNILLGGILRLRRTPSKIGLFIVHIGMLLFLVGGMITYHFADEGMMALEPGQTSSRFQSAAEWELAIIDTSRPDANIEYIIPERAFADVGAVGRRFRQAAIPFELELASFMPNALPRSAGGEIMLQPLATDRERSRNLAGAQARVRTSDGRELTAPLWAGALKPWAFEADGGSWAIELRRRQYDLPFSITLERFIHEFHPGTQMARTYESDVIKTEAGRQEAINIRMNEPLRHRGYTFFQSSYYPIPDSDQFGSVLAVVRNPADAMPLWATIVVTLGLLLHFGLKLARHLKRERGQGEAAKSSSAKLSRVHALLLGLLLGAIEATPANAFPGMGDPATAPAAMQPPASSPAVRRAILTPENIELLGSLAIQDQGRIKPLSTFARFKLVQLSGRASLRNAEGERVPALHWLAQLVLFPESMLDDKLFLIENPRLMQALGLSDAEPRARFSYLELVMVERKLGELARAAFQVESAQRDLTQRQILNLYENFVEFERLATALGSARVRVYPQPGTPLGEMFKVGEDTAPEGVPFADFLSRMPEVLALALAHDRATTISAADDATTGTRQVLQIISELQQVGTRSDRLTILPPSDPAREDWLAPGLLVDHAIGKRAIPAAELALTGRLDRLVQRLEQPEAFTAELAALRDEQHAAARARGEGRKLAAERFFYRADFFGRAQLLFIFGFLLIAVSWLAPRRRLAWRGGVGLTVLATVLLVTGIAVRSWLRGRPPITNLYETTLFVPATAIVLGLALEWINRRRVAASLAALLGVIGLFMANQYELKDGADTMGSLVAVLNSNFWLATHVTTITIGYSSGLLAAALAHIYITAGLLHRGGPEFQRSLGRMIYGIICFTLIFSLVGTVLGGIWANYSWGRFWGWDPKENGALMLVLWCLVLLHGRMGGYLRELGLAVGSVAMGMVVAFSWWGVNLLGVGLHSYGFTSGVMGWLVLFWASQTAVMLLGGALWFNQRPSRLVK